MLLANVDWAWYMSMGGASKRHPYVRWSDVFARSVRGTSGRMQPVLECLPAPLAVQCWKHRGVSPEQGREEPVPTVLPPESGAAFEQAQKNQAPDAIPSGSSDTSSSSTSSTSDEAQALGRGLHGTPAWNPGCEVYQHRRTKTLHLLPAGCEGFICGRRRTAEHRPYPGPILCAAQQCAQCDGGKPIRSAVGIVEALDRAKARRRLA